MNKQFYFQITNGEDEWESPYFPTKEEAEEAYEAAKDMGYEVGEIMEERV